MTRMLHIVLVDGKTARTVRVPPGTLLIDALRDHGAGLHAPCGGKGLCRKCRVDIESEGNLLSCQYRVTHDCRVILPSPSSEALIRIDSAQLRDVPLKPEIPLPAGPAFGVAADIGTTTVVVYLFDLRNGKRLDTLAFLNPQAEFGQDVISRIQFTLERKGGLATLRNKIVSSVNAALRLFERHEHVRPENIVKAVIAGNPTMLHLFKGADPGPIAVAPFTPAFITEQRMTGSESGLLMNPLGTVILLAGVSGYVGADITAGLTATPLRQFKTPSLFIDIGTNGEMALGSSDFILACSTAAGPAFEGAKIECGMGGVAGAVSAFQKGRYETIGHLRPAGICGSGLVDLVAHLLDAGRISPEGLMEENFVVEHAEKSSNGRDIVLTPRDIRETQLAMAAIHAGILVLTREAGLALRDIGTVYLAGGFGSYIRIESALRIGLLPRELEGRILSVGNTAGAGASLSLLSDPFRAEVADNAAQCRYIELSGLPAFNDAYIDCMMFPE